MFLIPKTLREAKDKGEALLTLLKVLESTAQYAITNKKKETNIAKFVVYALKDMTTTVYFTANA